MVASRLVEVVLPLYLFLMLMLTFALHTVLVPPVIGMLVLTQDHSVQMGCLKWQDYLE